MRLWSRPESLQWKIIGFILIISFFLLALSVFIAYIARENYQKAKYLEQTAQISKNIALVIQDVALERGRMNVVLRSLPPISEADRILIETRRGLSEGHFDSALNRLAAIQPEQAANLAAVHKELAAIRHLADTESRKPYEARRPELAGLWLWQLTGFIYTLDNVLLHLGRAQADSGQFFLYHQLVLDSLRFRQLAGRHATMATATLVRPDLPADKQEDEMAFARAQTDSLWANIVMQVEDLGRPELTQAKEEIFLRYYTIYRPEQEVQLSLARFSRADAASVLQLRELSVEALDSVYLLVEAADANMQEYVREMLFKTKWMLAAGIAQFTACLLLVVFCITYFERRVFKPMQRIIRAMELLGKHEAINIASEDLQRRDEIGQINKGVQQLQASIAEERRLMAENELLAMTDFLTGCLNKRGFYLLAEAELSRSARECTPTSFLFSDLDDLKQINDSYGHLVGDEAVKHFAACVTGQCRPYDLIGRFGGDEFVFCFPHTSEEQALQIVRRIQTALATTRFSVGNTGIQLQLSASFGLITSITGEERSVEWCIQQADAALYRAKQKGKNCVILDSDQNSRFC